MWLRQFVLESLGHASYLVGDEDTGQALLVDPRRDVGDYFEAARAAGMRIGYVLDTHAHNDYVSGITEVCARQPATALGYAQAGLGYPHRALDDGATLDLGELELELLHTPGHTPAHVCVLVRQHHGNAAAILLAGGALLVGGTGRPDLLGGPDEARRAAKAQHETLHKRLAHLPDDVEVYPTHVAGSLCGAGLGRGTWTTLGHERRSAEAFRIADPDEFAEATLAPGRLPAIPAYWRRMGPLNRAGPPALGVLPEPVALAPAEVASAAAAGAVVVDARGPDAFAAEHVPGALSVGAGPSFATWAGSVLPPDARVVLVLDRPADLWPLVWDLLRTGYAPPVGWLAGGLSAWVGAGLPVRRLPLLDAREAARRAGLGPGEAARAAGNGLILVDVRQPDEWVAGRVPGAILLTGAELPAERDRLPAGAELGLLCGAGYRSAVLASVLAAGGRSASVVVGGFAAWRAAGLPVEAGALPTEPAG